MPARDLSEEERPCCIYGLFAKDTCRQFAVELECGDALARDMTRSIKPKMSLETSSFVSYMHHETYTVFGIDFQQVFMMN